MTAALKVLPFMEDTHAPPLNARLVCYAHAQAAAALARVCGITARELMDEVQRAVNIDDPDAADRDAAVAKFYEVIGFERHMAGRDCR